MPYELQSSFDKKLIEQGLDAFPVNEKNSFILSLADLNQVSLTEITEAYLLQYHKDLKIKVFSSLCEDKIVEGFVSTTGRKYRTNRDDQINMIGQKDELESDPSITTVPWKTEDLGYIDHTREEWLAIYSEAFKHKKDTLLRYNLKKQQITSATGHGELVAISWDSPLPEVVADPVV